MSMRKILNVQACAIVAAFALCAAATPMAQADSVYADKIEGYAKLSLRQRFALAQQGGLAQFEALARFNQLPQVEAYAAASRAARLGR